MKPPRHAPSMRKKRCVGSFCLAAASSGAKISLIFPTSPVCMQRLMRALCVQKMYSASAWTTALPHMPQRIICLHADTATLPCSAAGWMRKTPLPCASAACWMHFQRAALPFLGRITCLRASHSPRPMRPWTLHFLRVLAAPPCSPCRILWPSARRVRSQTTAAPSRGTFPSWGLTALRLRTICFPGLPPCARMPKPLRAKAPRCLRWAFRTRPACGT